MQNALLELISEKREALARLGEDDCWAYIFDKFRKVREMRNALAHGHPQTLIIRNKPYVRVVPPVFDVIQISRKIAKRQIPGLKSTDIAAGLTPIPRLIDCFDCINRIVADAHGAGIPWSDRVHELEVSLTALRSLYPDGQKPPET